MSLFTDTELEELVNREPEPEKRREMYHDNRGRFTDPQTAAMHELKREASKEKRNSDYWKRVAQRLADEYRIEHVKNVELTDKLKQYESKNHEYHQIDGIGHHTIPSVCADSNNLH